MKALLICPAERPDVRALAEFVPLANLPLLGKSLIEYWLEDLVVRRVKHVFVLVADRFDEVRALVGDGTRWGLRAEVLLESSELSPDEFRVKYRASDEPDWLPSPDDIVVMDHLPGLPQQPLFASYAAWFAALLERMSRASTPDRIGLREIRPGVWMGLHARVSPGAELRAPCWLGENAYVGPDAVIGPRTILEDRVFVEGGAEIADSIVGPETFVGALTRIKDSLAWGNRLVNWRTNSCMEVPDRFLLGALNKPHYSPELLGRLSRLASFLASAVKRSTGPVKIHNLNHGLSPLLRPREELYSRAIQVTLSERTGTAPSNEQI